MGLTAEDGDRMKASIGCIDLLGMSIASVDSEGVLDRIFASLERGEGGWLVTANLDILRRHHREADARALYDAADLRVADGMPLVWASRLANEPLPERVTGSGLTPAIAERAAREGRSVYLLGGAEGAAEGAARVFRERSPALSLAGISSPFVDSPATSEQVAAIAAELAPLAPDVILVGLGSPKQEHLIRALMPHLPRAYFIGVGVSFSFVAGQVHRAPPWMRRAGLEWAHRLSQEPGRLARRYLVDDLPFAFRLLGTSFLAGIRKKRRNSGPSRG